VSLLQKLGFAVKIKRLQIQNQKVVLFTHHGEKLENLLLQNLTRG